MTPILKFLAATLLVLSLLAGMSRAYAGSEDELAAIRERIAAEFDTIGPQHVNPSPVPGWYTIQKGTVIAYVSGDGRFLLQGDLIDLEAQVNLSEIARDESRRNLVAALGDDEVISFAPATTKHSVTVFTDIGCTYCRRLHKEIATYLAEGIEVRYVLYPRNGPTSQDWAESQKVWCSPDRNSALTAAKQDRPFETSACDASIIEAHYALGQEVGLSGTPAIVLENGTLIGGYVPADVLAEQLENAEPQARRAE